jgi:hypothetical protein
MSIAYINGRDLCISLTRSEKIAGLRGDLRVPLSAVTSVELLPDALAGVKGVRAPGLALPGLRKVGTWRTREGAEFVLARAGESGVRVRLEGQRLSSLLLGAPDADELAQAIEAAR